MVEIYYISFQVLAIFYKSSFHLFFLTFLTVTYRIITATLTVDGPLGVPP